MQHNERKLLMARLQEVIVATCGNAAMEKTRLALDRHLDQLLNDFLHESQPMLAIDATVLLVDLRGFTAIAESHPVDMVIDMLNRYFVAMTEEVAAHGGVVDKFMGDSVMALFGVPTRGNDDLQRALACAVRMQQAMGELNRVNEARGHPRLYAGIGLNAGPVMAGSFGSKIHSEYTVIGEPVNLAARIVGYSLRGQILVSEVVRNRAAAFIETGSCNRVHVKGKSDEVALYELTAVTAPQRLSVPPVEARHSPRIQVDLPLVFRRLSGKQVLPRKHHGRVLDLSYEGMRAQLPLRLDAYSEIVMTVTPDLAGAVETDLYAKVLHSREDDDGCISSLQFTAMDTPAQRAVKHYVDQSLWGR